uniref:Putative tail protein n=1 Tax=viral metagenome TaxID=1070528 RepID=A0A6M3KBB9_9ZZZZ
MGLKYKLNRVRNRGKAVAQLAFGGGAIIAHTELVARKLVDGVEVDRRRVVKDKVVTDAFVAFVVDQLQVETSTFGDFKFHEMGLGVVAEAAGDTALGTTTGIARVTGTQVEGATGNIYKSVGTITADTTEAITEHGLFNIATAGTMMDRTVFSAINVVSGNQIEFTFQITFSSGG